MKREYVKGNKKHWREIYKYVYGMVPKTETAMGICGNDKAIYIKNSMGGFILYTNSAVYDAVTTNPNWHEVKPWEKHYEPKPFDKVLGWHEDENAAQPDIFLYKDAKDYICANTFYKHIKPYNEEKYMKLIQKTK